MTPNELVALRLKFARELRGLTQAQAAERLEPFLGTRLGKGAYSAAERSSETGRTRRFDADELWAFARAFELPISFFFCPPRADLKIGHPDSSETSSGVEYMALIFGLDSQVRVEIAQALKDRGVRERLEIMRRYADSVTAAVDEQERQIMEAAEVADELREEKGK